MAKISDVMADMDKVENGTWQNYSAGIQLLIANINNSEYKKERSKILKPYLRRLRTNAISADDILELLKPAAAKYLLKDWRNIEDDDGTAIPYSPEKALEFFKNPALNDFFNFVMEVAGENEFFSQSLLQDSAKN